MRSKGIPDTFQPYFRLVLLPGAFKKQHFQKETRMSSFINSTHQHVSKSIQ